METTAEMRWFWNSPSTPELERWFFGGAFPPGGGRTREDRYLIDLGQAELGIKSRGKTSGGEIKGLVHRIPEPVAIKNIPGHPQIWSKWTSKAIALDSMPTLLLKKKRLIRRFQIGDATVREIALGENESPLASESESSKEGCTLELTEISFQSSATPWWTLGFEASGTLPSIEKNLRRTVIHVAEDGIPLPADAIELSYPEWIDLIERSL